MFSSVTIDVMHHLTRLQVTLEHFLRQQPMYTNRFAVTPRSRVRIALRFHTRILPLGQQKSHSRVTENLKLIRHQNP
jgi:Mlc titration factor MtfA (ptsG expression regulator)